MQHPRPSSQAEPPPPSPLRHHLSTSRAIVLYFPPATTHSPRISRQLIFGQTPVWLTGPWWSVRIRDHTNTRAHTQTHRGFFSALLTHTRQGERERIEKKVPRKETSSLEVSFGFLLLLWSKIFVCVCVCVRASEMVG